MFQSFMKSGRHYRARSETRNPKGAREWRWVSRLQAVRMQNGNLPPEAGHRTRPTQRRWLMAFRPKDLAGNFKFRQCLRMVRLVLFDVDGTLVHTGRAGSQAFAKTFATEFNAHDGIEKIKFAGRTDVSLVREFFGYHNIPATPENFQRFFERFVFWLDRMVAQGNGEICRGVPEFLDELRTLPHPPVLGLLTGNIRLGAEIKLRRYGLWHLFETGGFADDHEDRNHIAAAALERGRRVLGKNLRPEEIVVVGDTPFDIRCGKFIGAKVLAVATGGAKLDELKRHQPDWVVEDLTRVSAREVCDQR
jgi:phosphoglycolate phosphatase-like HAD superfamily hydrolase